MVSLRRDHMISMTIPTCPNLGYRTINMVLDVLEKSLPYQTMSVVWVSHTVPKSLESESYQLQSLTPTNRQL